MAFDREDRVDDAKIKPYESRDMFLHVPNFVDHAVDSTPDDVDATKTHIPYQTLGSGLGLGFDTFLRLARAPIHLFTCRNNFNVVVNTYIDKQRVLMNGHQGWNIWRGLCHIYMRYV